MRRHLLIVLVLACGGGLGDDAPAIAMAEATPTKPAKAPANTFMPTLKFREHAAKVFGVPASDVEGGPVDKADAASKPQTVGDAWGVFVYPRGNHQRELRGWVKADGTVITAEQNLGLLLAEAGLWAKDRKATDRDLAQKLAELLVWSYGYGHILVRVRELALAPPAMTRKPDGMGELVFFTDYKSPGPGGAGGGPDAFTEHRVTFKADRTATLAKTKK